MTIGLIANLEDGLSVRNKLNALIGIANKDLINPGEAGFNAVGDGTTDDTAALTAAINAAISEGRGLWLPADKVYRVTSHLPSFTNGMIILGGGTIKAPNAVNCLRHFPAGWATGATERTVTSLSLGANWQGQSGHSVTIVNMANTSGLAVGQWVKIGSNSITIPGSSLNYWFEWAQIRAITTNANVTLDRVLEGHARGLMPGVHANYRMFAFPTTIRPVIVDVRFEADEAAASIHDTTLTGRSPFFMDRGSVNAIVRIRGRRWWTTVAYTHGILSQLDIGWEELADITDVASANESLGYGVTCSSGAHAVSATVIGGTCRHGFTTTANTLSAYDATRPFELGLSFYCGTTPASRISGASSAAFDTHVQSFGARLFGEATAGVEQVNSDASSLGVQDRGFNTTLGVRVTSAHYRGLQLAAAQTNWGSLGECITLVDDFECRDVNGGSHIIILGTSGLSAITTLLRSPLFVGSPVADFPGVVISSGYSGKLIMHNPIFRNFDSRLIQDESGRADIEMYGGHVHYGIASPPPPFLVTSGAANRGDGTTSSFLLEDLFLRQVSANLPNGLFQNDNSLPMNVRLGRVLSQLGDLPLRSPSSAGAGAVPLTVLFDTGDRTPFANASGSMAAASSGRNWRMVGNVTAVPISDGWHGKFFNSSGGALSLTPGSGVCVVVESGATAGSVSIANNKAVQVTGDGTNLWVRGDVV